LELQHALAVEVGEPELDEGNFTQIEDMVSVCAGLVTVDEETNIVRLVHYTTQEYFKRTQDQWFPNAENDIIAICVTYLSFSVFESGFCQTDDEFEERLGSNPLYDYAARNWGYHARTASAEVESLIIRLLESGTKVSSSSQAMMASREYISPYSQRVPRRMTGVHLAAYFGRVETTMALLKNRHDLDSKDTYGRTPLSWAAKSGHEAVVKLLLEEGAELETKDDDGQTPLSWAAESGHEAVVKLLLEKGTKLETKDTYFGRTPLSWAAKSGHEAVVKLLLEKGTKLETKDTYYGQTPLSLATENGHEAVVKLLLEKGAKLETKDMYYGRTPLSRAAASGHEAVVKLLLEKGARHYNNP
jgi:ankyrin repeat protein